MTNHSPNGRTSQIGRPSILFGPTITSDGCRVTVLRRADGSCFKVTVRGPDGRHATITELV